MGDRLTLTGLRRDIRAAVRRLDGRVRRTPVERSVTLSKRTGADVWLKLEHLQETGSFKLRGATNKLLTLDRSDRREGVVAASSGNHGLAVATAAAALETPALVFVPKVAAPIKVAGIRARGAEVRVFGEDCVEAETRARDHATRTGRTFLSPYNDPAVVAGQGTLGVELRAQVPKLDAVFASIGGGGMIGGMAAALKGGRSAPRIVGAQPANSAVMTASMKAGRLLDLPSEETLSDGTAGGIESDAITFDLCRRLVDDFVLVDEEEIAAAMRLLIADHQWLVEGAAAVALAALLKGRRRWRGKRVAVVLCGRNVSADVVRRVLAGA